MVSKVTRNTIVFIILTLLVSWQTSHADAPEKHRLLVLTDMGADPDDQQSLVRLLLYSNQIDIEGLVATTSVWHKTSVDPEFITDIIQAYDAVHPNLALHEPGFPEADELRSLVKTGIAEYGMLGVGEGKDSEGSNWLIKMLEKDDPRPLWVSVWGGVNTLAQALYQIDATNSDAKARELISKLRVYTISDQDDAGRWLRLEFPGLFYVVSPSNTHWKEYWRATWTGIAGDRHYANGPFHAFELVDNPWLEENVIQNHGPLGALYPKLEYIMEGGALGDMVILIGTVDPVMGEVDR